MTVDVCISANCLSIGILSSYNVGACKIIPAVPTKTASVKIQRNSLSKTIATYFQSSLTLKPNFYLFINSIIDRIDRSIDRSSLPLSNLPTFLYVRQ